MKKRIKRNNLYLDNLISINEKGESVILPDTCGLVIKIDSQNESLPIAYIYWNETDQDCYIQTVKDRFQTYIVLYETFGDFIYLVDEAYDMLREIHLYKPEE